jgi:glycogen operon protein
VIRGFWKGDAGLVGEVAYRLMGSSDLYAHNGRRPYASVNFITAHDGFTLADLVSYNDKHNEANGEDNHDGHDHNVSWNCGVEGPTDDPAILALRARQQRNLLTTLILSQGVPMLIAGDEIGHTQHGNNNAYCQDNEISWLDWNLDQPKRELLEFSKFVIRIFHQHPVFRRRNFFQGRQLRGTHIKDLMWFRPDGREMTDEDWQTQFARGLGIRLAGDAIDEVDARGNRIVDETFLLLLNAHHETLLFTLPAPQQGQRWELMLDTRNSMPQPGRWQIERNRRYDMEARSTALFCLRQHQTKRVKDTRPTVDTIMPNGHQQTTLELVPDRSPQLSSSDSDDRRDR